VSTVSSVVILLCVLCSSSVSAQVTVGIEYDRDRYTYHFDNPSTFDTAAPVPHFFEQTYDADNLWLVASARYVAAIPLETTGGITPTRESTGDDYDTFFDPDGTVFVSGTTGPISIHSWRIGQLAEVARIGRASITVSYQLRADKSDFHVGHKTVVRNGAVIAASDVTSPEFTSSFVHNIAGGVRIGGFSAEVAPMMLGRLTVQLPEKYPGQDLVFLAKGASASASFTVTRSHLSFAVNAHHTWSYSSTASLARNIIAVRVGFMM